jgi:hypothetical protein
MPTYQVLYNESSSRFLDPADKVSREDYVDVATLRAESPDDVFMKMNAVNGDEMCCQLRVRSMSTGDLVVDENGVVTGCCGCGWREVRFA